RAQPPRTARDALVAAPEARPLAPPARVAPAAAALVVRAAPAAPPPAPEDRRVTERRGRESRATAFGSGRTEAAGSHRGRKASGGEEPSNTVLQEAEGPAGAARPQESEHGGRREANPRPERPSNTVLQGPSTAVSAARDGP